MRNHYTDSSPFARNAAVTTSRRPVHQRRVYTRFPISLHADARDRRLTGVETQSIQLDVDDMRPDVLYTGISTYYYSPPAGMAGARRPPAYAAFLHPHPLRGWPHLRHMYCLGARGGADAEAVFRIVAGGSEKLKDFFNERRSHSTSKNFRSQSLSRLKWVSRRAE